MREDNKYAFVFLKLFDALSSAQRARQCINWCNINAMAGSLDKAKLAK